MLSTGPIGNGFLRADGKKGIRNKVLVIFTVDCSSFVASSVARHFKEIKEDVDFLGSRTCDDNQVIIRRLLSYSVHPNVGAVVIIGNGCEYLRPDKLCEFAKQEGRLADWFYLQEIGGTRKGIDRGIALVTEFIEELKKVPRVPLYLKDLIFGAKCGGSDFTSGLVGNTLVGRFFDEIIDLGGTCIFEELVEAIGLRDYLAGRAINEKVRQDIIDAYDKTIYICKQGGQFAISPGNFDGGLTTIEEKSLGSTVKSGTRPISGILKIAQRPQKPGLYILDVLNDAHYDVNWITGGDAYTMMDLVSLGVHINFLVTGRGHTIGNPIAPCIKITGNPQTWKRMSEDIDINSSDILEGKMNMDEKTGELLAYVSEICRGSKTKAEALGHQEGEFVNAVQNACKVIRPVKV
jgi:altronate hydrolase